MDTKDNRQDAHNEIDHIFRDLLPAQGMAERPAQMALSHQMMDAMLEGGIALCDAGTGIGKTYAYLVAGTVFHRYRATRGLAPRPLLISTSSIALQDAVLNDYLPFLSKLLLADGMLQAPLRAIIRKGKAHYVCDKRLEQRLQAVDLERKNPQAREALLSLRDHLDLDMAPHLSSYDRERVCVPQVCDCRQDDCRYRCFMEVCGAGRHQFQICNHNLLLADAIHRSTGKRPIFPEYSGLVIDEAHKLPETARQMFGVTLMAEELRALIHSLRRERYSHGFRMNKSCHTALKYVQKYFTGTKWFVEGDIKGCFDNVDHHVLIAILRKRIADEHFIGLLWKFLKAGYMEDWNYHNTYSGTPQGSIISPILANIYMNELDSYMAEYEEKFKCGNRRKINPAFKKKLDVCRGKEERLKRNLSKMSEEEKEGLIAEIRELRCNLKSIPYSDPMDDSYKRIFYVRYADDFLIGVIGSKEDAEQVKQDVGCFIREKLHLEMSEEKTLGLV